MPSAKLVAGIKHWVSCGLIGKVIEEEATDHVNTEGPDIEHLATFFISICMQGWRRAEEPKNILFLDAISTPNTVIDMRPEWCPRPQDCTLSVVTPP